MSVTALKTITYEVTVLAGVEGTEERKRFMTDTHRCRQRDGETVRQAVERAVRRAMKLAPDQEVLVLLPGDPPGNVEVIADTAVAEVLHD